MVVTPNNVADHLRTWKNRWSRISRVKNLSGSGWDDLKIVILDKEVVDAYVEVIDL